MSQETLAPFSDEQSGLPLGAPAAASAVWSQILVSLFPGSAAGAAARLLRARPAVFRRGAGRPAAGDSLQEAEEEAEQDGEADRRRQQQDARRHISCAQRLQRPLSHTAAQSHVFLVN